MTNTVRQLTNILCRNIGVTSAAQLLALLDVDSDDDESPFEALLRTPVNNIEYFPPNFEGLVLGCIDADFCK